MAKEPPKNPYAGNEPEPAKTAKEAAETAGAAVNFRGSYGKYAGSRAPPKGSAAEAELIAADKMGYQGSYGNLPIRIARQINDEDNIEGIIPVKRERDAARWILGDPQGSYSEGVSEVRPVSSQMEGEHEGDVTVFDPEGRTVAKYDPSSRPGYHRPQDLGDEETQERVDDLLDEEEEESHADRFARTGEILLDQFEEAQRTPTTVDDRYFMGELQKWGTIGVETSAAYHDFGRKLGVPIPANPHENWGDVSLAFVKAGNPKDNFSKNYLFNPNVGDLLDTLPGGQGLQEVAWDAAIGTKRWRDIGSFGTAVRVVSSSRARMGPYGALFGGINDVISATPPEASEWAIDATARTAIEAKFLGKDMFPQNSPIKGSATERFAFDEYGRVLRPGGTFEPVYSADGVPFNKKMGKGEYVYVGEYQYDTGETVSRFYEKNVGSFVDFDEMGRAGIHVTGVRSGGGPGSYYETNLPPAQKSLVEISPGVYLTGFIGAIDAVRQSIIPSVSAMTFEETISGKGESGKGLPNFEDYYTERTGSYNKNLEAYTKKLEAYNAGGMRDKEVYKELMREEVSLIKESNTIRALSSAKTGLDQVRYAIDQYDSEMRLSGVGRTSNVEEFQTSQGRFASGVNANFFQNIPVLADINKAGRAFALESKIDILSKQLGEQTQKIKTGEDYTRAAELEGRIGNLQAEHDRIASEMTGGLKWEGLGTKKFYDFMHEKSQWYDKNVSKPFSDWTIGAATNTTAGRVFEKTTGLENTGPLRAYVPFYSPRIMAEAATGFVGSPGVAAEFAGMIPLGAETLVRHPESVLALAAVGIATQGKGMWEGFTGPTPFKFAAEQAGTIVALHYAGRGARALSPIEFARVELPNYKSGTTTYYTMLAKKPLSQVESGGIPLVGVARTGRSGFDVSISNMLQRTPVFKATLNAPDLTALERSFVNRYVLNKPGAIGRLLESTHAEMIRVSKLEPSPRYTDWDESFVTTSEMRELVGKEADFYHATSSYRTMNRLRGFGSVVVDTGDALYFTRNEVYRSFLGHNRGGLIRLKDSPIRNTKYESALASLKKTADKYGYEIWSTERKAAKLQSGLPSGNLYPGLRPSLGIKVSHAIEKEFIVPDGSTVYHQLSSFERLTAGTRYRYLGEKWTISDELAGYDEFGDAITRGNRRVPIVDVSLTRPAGSSSPLVSSVRTGYKYTLNPDFIRISVPKNLHWFIGSPDTILSRTGFRTTSPTESLTPWSRGQHAILDDFLSRNLPEKQAELIRSYPGAIEAIHSRLYVPEQRELFGLVPSKSASRTTIAGISRVWERYGANMRAGGSRALRAFAGEGARYESLFDSDYDTYVNRDYMPGVYRETLSEVLKEYPDAESVRNPDKGGKTKPGTFLGTKQSSITTISGEEFFHTKPFEVYPYMIERGTTQIRAVGGATIHAIRPQLMLQRKIAAMVKLVEMEPGGTPRLITDRVKDIADAYSLSRAASETMYHGATIDVAGTITGMKIKRAAALERFSVAARGYADVLPEAQRVEAAGFFKEMRVDLLEGVNRNPQPAYDVVTGQGLVSPQYRTAYRAAVTMAGGALVGSLVSPLGVPGVLAGVIFPGMKSIGVKDISRKNVAQYDIKSLVKNFALVDEYPLVKYTKDIEILPSNVIQKSNLYPVGYVKSINRVRLYPGFTKNKLYPTTLRNLLYPVKPGTRTLLPKLFTSVYPEETSSTRLYPVKTPVSPEIYPTTVNIPTTPVYPVITDVVEYPGSPIFIDSPRPPTNIRNPYPTQIRPPELYPTVRFAPVSTSTQPVPAYGSGKIRNRRRKRGRSAKEWYIWNPVPTMETLFGYQLNIREIMPEIDKSERIMSTKQPKMKLPKYKMPKM